jgi:hypothetical protein
MAGNTSLVCSFSYNNIHQPGDGNVVLWFSLNLVPHLGWSVTWMNRIPVYWLCFRLVRSWSCTHDICGMDGNISMSCGYSLNNTLNPEDGIDVL